jgi:hypothetical protein
VYSNIKKVKLDSEQNGRVRTATATWRCCNTSIEAGQKAFMSYLCSEQVRLVSE